MNKQSFGPLADGRETTLFTLTNNSGMSVSITDYGGTIVNILVPDRIGQIGDVSLGHECAADYENNEAFMGCLIGRHANRIANGQFQLDGVSYQLAINNPPNNLHGGPGGFHSKIWLVDEATHSKLALRTTSSDGEEGFPGNIEVQVIYSLSHADELTIEYRGRTDAPTVMNLTNHAYFNLAESGRVDDHEVQIFADQITLVDDVSIPTGEFLEVAGTPFDLRQPSRIGNGLESDHEQIKLGSGYDHNFVIQNGGDRLIQAAKVSEPITGRIMDVFTTEPGIQLYTGNFLKGQVGKFGQIYNPHTGFCLETQKFPDSPNKPHFPSAVLRPDEEYQQTTIYQFSVK